MLIVLTALAVLSVAQRERPPDDFAFRLEYGFCNTDVADTFQDSFVRDLGGLEPAVSVPLELPQESFNQAYRAIVAADFFNYPSEFRTTPKSNCTRTQKEDGSSGTVSCSGISAIAPARHYRLTVRESGVTHTVSWRDNVTPTTEDATRLRHMLTTIVEMIRGLPQVQRLPVSRVPCA